MPRPSYAFLLAAVMLVPCGCAAPAWWRGGDSEDADEGAGPMTPRAGSAVSAATEINEKTAGAPKTPTNIARRSSSTASNRADTATDAQHQQPGKGTPLRESPGQEPDAESTAADPLVAQVRALDFDDPAEEASALAALRAAPDSHRSFLLRTMRASAAVRKQNEARARTPFPSAERQGEGISKASTSNHSGASSATATSSEIVAHDRHATSPRGKPVVDPNAAAPAVAEPAVESQGVVRPASYSGSANPAGARRAFDTPTKTAIEPPGQATAVWQTHLGSAISELETQLARGGAADRPAMEARLRLLYLAADRRDEALRSRQATSLDEQEFWSKEAYGLAALLDTAKEPDAQRRAGIAAPHLRQAAERLGEISGMAVKNLRFCTEVKGYGSFVSFPQDEFRPGQEVLLYCEVENFHSKLTDKGYHTALKARYQVFDAGGNRVAEKDLGLKEEHCLNRRRDFFVPYFLWAPKQVPAGKYQLKLTLEDVHAGKTAEATIEFSIKEK